VKCGIVTVYNSENCGSYLQAYALSKTLKNNGHEPVFVGLKFGEHSITRKNYLKRLVKIALRGNLAGAKRAAGRRKSFQEAIAKHLQVVKNAEGLDCCILGSDVIWDVTSRLFRNHPDFFWGSQFAPQKVISYAPSVGFSDKEDLKKVGFIQEALHHISAVSVRDEVSKELLQPYCDKDIHMVCDPTYLIDRADYDAIAKPTDLEKFIFLYCYKNLPPADQAVIQAIAEREELKTVTFGEFNAWCDIRLAYDPLLFLSIYDKADYIITDTFHGTVFATIYEKRFAVVNNDKQKVLNVLAMCEMSDKMTKTAEDYAAILHGDYDYETTRKNILRERENSLRFLNEALEERKIND